MLAQGKRAMELWRLLGWRGILKSGMRIARRRAGGYPQSITVESSSLCNLNCPFCVRRDVNLDEYRAKRFLSLEEFERLVDDVDGFCHAIQFSCYGEPLLNSALESMVRYASNRRIFTTLFTNATLMTPERSEALVDAGLTRVMASWESFHPDVYEAAKEGANYEATRRNVSALLECRRRKRSRHPEVVLRVVVTRKNAAELEAYRAAARELGVDAVSQKPLTIWPQGTGGYKRKMRDEFALEHPVSHYRRGPDGELISVDREQECPSLGTPAILSDGSVCLCWYDALGESIVGNINDDSFRAIWERSEGFRREKMSRGDALTICSECAGVGPRLNEILKV